MLIKEAYVLLELNPPCSSEDIRKAYKKMALRYHPDKQIEPSHDKFIKISEAYKILYIDKNEKKTDKGLNPYELFNNMFPYLRKTFIESCQYMLEHGITLDTLTYIYVFYSNYKSTITTSLFNSLVIKKEIPIYIEKVYNRIFIKKTIDVPYIDIHNNINNLELYLFINIITSEILTVPKNINIKIPEYIKNIEYSLHLQTNHDNLYILGTNLIYIFKTDSNVIIDYPLEFSLEKIKKEKIFIATGQGLYTNMEKQRGDLYICITDSLNVNLENITKENNLIKLNI